MLQPYVPSLQREQRKQRLCAARRTLHDGCLHLVCVRAA